MLAAKMVRWRRMLPGVDVARVVAKDCAVLSADLGWAMRSLIMLVERMPRRCVCMRVCVCVVCVYVCVGGGNKRGVAVWVWVWVVGWLGGWVGLDVAFGCCLSSA